MLTTVVTRIPHKGRQHSDCKVTKLAKLSPATINAATRKNFPQLVYTFAV